MRATASLLCLLPRRPPTSPLFPYTTLFRSLAGSTRQSGPEWSSGGTCRSTLQSCHRADRKSTRLNSSHDQISYAVFCLKKKTSAAAGDDRQAAGLRFEQREAERLVDRRPDT